MFIKKPIELIKKRLSSNSSDVISADANIRLVGAQSSGKTAYMASLAYFPNANPDSPVESVTSVGDKEAGKELIRFAKLILEQGLQLEATNINKADVTDIQDYGLSIELKPQFSWNPSQLGYHPIKLTINCKDYTGEFFKDLIYNPNNPWLEDYLQDCQRATGILLLVDGSSDKNDTDLAKGLQNFLQTLKERDQMQTDTEQKTRRIAFVLNKCELPELWHTRDKPEYLSKKCFPKMVNHLENWANQRERQIDFFTASAFGTLGNSDEGNTTIIQRSTGATTCVIREPKKWRPFGLVSPIYWLCTGKRHKELDKD